MVNFNGRDSSRALIHHKRHQNYYTLNSSNKHKGCQALLILASGKLMNELEI